MSLYRCGANGGGTISPVLIDKNSTEFGTGTVYTCDSAGTYLICASDCDTNTSRVVDLTTTGEVLLDNYRTTTSGKNTYHTHIRDMIIKMAVGDTIKYTQSNFIYLFYALYKLT